jgi:hypothetical protein
MAHLRVLRITSLGSVAFHDENTRLVLPRQARDTREQHLNKRRTFGSCPQADDALMAFQHRMCISGDADRVAWPKPEGYKKEDFLLMQRCGNTPLAHISY